MKLQRLWILLCVLLSACAAGPTLRSEEEPPEEWASSFEEGCEHDSAVVLLCAERECGFFACRDLNLETGGVQLTRGGGGIIAPPAAPGGRPQRWWGWSWLRRDARPILTFRLYAALDPKPPRPLLPPGRYIRHHVFPQAPDLAAWFKRQGVNIHSFTLLIPEHVHQRIHSGGPRGGLWNEAWRAFRKANETAPQRKSTGSQGNSFTASN